jgi:hypothetical protein
MLACLMAFAVLEDPWAVASGCSTNDLLIVAADDNPDDSTEHMPPCASAGVGHTNPLPPFFRWAAYLWNSSDLSDGSYLRCVQRGPPDERSYSAQFCHATFTVGSLGIVAGIAAVLASYLPKDTFGTIADYLALFLSGFSSTTAAGILSALLLWQPKPKA